MLHQQVVDEKKALIVLSFLVDPEFLLRDVRIPVMLADIGELLIDVPADVYAIDYPNLVVAACFIFL
ncbi:MAG: hypothetical protein NTV38_08930 [Chloroflexi bacterium]|nr:hypothetical protein [Chloroflexota bacterium]